MKRIAKTVVFLLCACLICACFTGCAASDEKKALEMLSGAWVDEENNGMYFDTEEMRMYDINNGVVDSTPWDTKFEYSRKSRNDYCKGYFFVRIESDKEFSITIPHDKSKKPYIIWNSELFHDDSITR